MFASRSARFLIALGLFAIHHPKGGRFACVMVATRTAFCGRPTIGIDRAEKVGIVNDNGGGVGLGMIPAPHANRHPKGRDNKTHESAITLFHRIILDTACPWSASVGMGSQSTRTSSTFVAPSPALRRRSLRRSEGVRARAPRLCSRRGRSIAWSCPDLADRFDCFNHSDALVSNSMGET